MSFTGSCHVGGFFRLRLGENQSIGYGTGARYPDFWDGYVSPKRAVG